MSYSRPSWNKYFYQVAKLVASRSTCPRAACGAVIISKDNRIIATGYNGVPPNHPHCDDVGCFLVDNHCTRSIHAELNAVNQCRKYYPELIVLGGLRIYVYRKNTTGGSVGKGLCKECKGFIKKNQIQIVGCWDE